MISFPNCKINLGLFILNKRGDGFHDLETVFYPVALYDALEIIQNTTPGSEGIEFTSTGITIDGNEDDNICIKAYQLLKINFPELPAVKMHLHKTIPIGAGLGGGSADGAFTLKLLNNKFNLGLTPDQLIQYALHLGSDCPFFILNKPSIATGRGEFLKEVKFELSNYKIVLINPGIHINTGWAFSRVEPNDERTPIEDIIKQPVEEWKNGLSNDFEEAIFSHHPEIKQIKEQLYNAGVTYAAMSGSGSTVYGIYKNEVELPSFPDDYFIKIIG